MAHIEIFSALFRFFVHSEGGIAGALSVVIFVEISLIGFSITSIDRELKDGQLTIAPLLPLFLLALLIWFQSLLGNKDIIIVDVQSFYVVLIAHGIICDDVHSRRSRKKLVSFMIILQFLVHPDTIYNSVLVAITKFCFSIISTHAHKKILFLKAQIFEHHKKYLKLLM